MFHRHPNKLTQNHFEHSIENISFGEWHEMKPLSLLDKNKKNVIY